MEEVEILPRDAYLHTINVVQAPCTIQWWFSTKRKNIDFGLFQRAGSDSGSHTGSRESSVGTTTGRRMAALQHESEGLWGAAEVAAKQRGGYFKLQDRNVVELMGLRHYESSKTTIKGSWQVEEPGTYVLYFDNSFSKNTSKRLSFCVAVKEVRQGSAASSGRPAVMSGWLLKKKRKRMQGWARRWITLQGQWLLYSTTEGGIPRARVDIYSAVVSTSRADRTLTIDGDEGFLQLRAQTDVAFDAWVAALKKTKEMYMLGSVGDGATLSGAVMGSPREDSLAQVQQAHVVFETSVDQLVQLLGALGEVPDAAFHEHMEGVVQQIRNSEAVLHGAAKAAATAAAAGAGIMRHDTDPCGRPSLSATDTQMSVFSGSAAASDVFYDTNEVLELARDDSDQTPPLGAGTDNTGTLDVDSDDVSDSDDEYFGGPRAPQTDRMRRDLVRDPDFIEALAQNKLRGSTTSASARSGTAAAAAAADEVTKDVASGLDGRLVATIERVREQLDGFESRITLPAEAGEVNVSLLSILRKKRW